MKQLSVLLIGLLACLSCSTDKKDQFVDEEEVSIINSLMEKHPTLQFTKTEKGTVDYIFIDSLHDGEIPLEIKKFKHLKAISLHGSLSELPPWISKLAITEVYLGKNKFKHFPKQLLEMNQLELIVLTENPISSIDDTLYFPKLEKFWMPGTKISKFPIIKQEENSPAIYFHLAETLIDSIPDEISSMKIKKIWMTDCNQLTYISPNLGQQDSLEELNFSFNAEFGTAFYNRNSIPRTIPIPEEIKHCKNLKNLDLEYNELTSIPDYVFEIPSLEILGFRGNKISEIPEKISKLQKLRRIYVTNNQLKTLPKAFGQMPNLETISVWGNAISKENLPVEMFDISREKRCSLLLNMFQDRSFEGLPVSQEQFERGYRWYGRQY
ncbi:leucine-rich repeat domain-containing protein [Persicobacter psychrovividus]|uniref:Leucine rich repeat (LRR) protein n=1 Tax=Persicobacter psychrovividus TaxID=387638 RepID=A0ABM7VK19_9BACT|nr:hypothetical protein PEPS_36080 [Persicobacter psychrovividus]